MSAHLYAATTNPGKIKEYNQMARTCGVEVLPLQGLKDLPEVEETGHTFSANARLKAEAYSLVASKNTDTGSNVEPLVFADDSGLCVDALDGKPGVHSARYSLNDGYDETFNKIAPNNLDRPSIDAANNAKLLRDLEKRSLESGRGVSRNARFVCVIAVARNGKTLAEFTGEVHGAILNTPRGSGGFGYDPLFYFPELKKTFAELSEDEKSQYNHRGIAFRKMLESVDHL